MVATVQHERLYGIRQHITLWHTQWQQLYNIGYCTERGNTEHWHTKWCQLCNMKQLHGVQQCITTVAYTVAVTHCATWATVQHVATQNTGTQNGSNCTI